MGTPPPFAIIVSSLKIIIIKKVSVKILCINSTGREKHEPTFSVNEFIIFLKDQSFCAVSFEVTGHRLILFID